MKKLQLASLGLLVLVAAASAIGCTKDSSAIRTAEATRKPEARKPEAEKPRFVSLVIPVGSSLIASLTTHLSTETNHDGDGFDATTIDPVMVSGRTVIPAGARIHGVLRDVQASGRVKGRARMTLAYESIFDAEGKSHSLSAQPLTLQAASDTHSDVEKIAAGGVLGAIVGGIAGGGKGAAIGAGAGAGAGTILMLATKGEDVELEAGQKLSILTTSSTSVDVLAQL